MEMLVSKFKVGQLGAFDHYGREFPFELESSSLGHYSYYLVIETNCEESLYPSGHKNIYYDVVDLCTGQLHNFGDKYFESHFTPIS